MINCGPYSALVVCKTLTFGGTILRMMFIFSRGLSGFFFTFCVWLTIINASAFAHCTSLNHVEILNCKKIAELAFYNTSSLTHFKLSKTVDIHQSAFMDSGCENKHYMAGGDICNCEQCPVSTPPSSSGMSTGTIIGIVTASGLVTLGGVGAVYMYHTKHTSSIESGSLL